MKKDHRPMVFFYILATRWSVNVVLYDNTCSWRIRATYNCGIITTVIKMDEHWLYVIRYRDTGDAVYCGMTNSLYDRWIAHACNGCLANVDPDDYEFFPLTRLDCDRAAVFEYEQRFSEHLLASGEPLRNKNVGAVPVFANKPFTVFDVLTATGDVALCAFTRCKFGDNYETAQLMRRLFKVHHELRALDRKRCTLRVVAANVADRVSARELVEARLAAIAAGEVVDANGDVVVPCWSSRSVRAYEATVTAARIAKRAITLHERSQKLVRCVETGDLFSSEVDASKWAVCNGPEVYRAERDKRRTAGGFHWEQVNRECVDFNDVHKLYTWLAFHGIIDVVDERLRPVTNRAVPVQWCIDGEVFHGNTTHWHVAGKNHRYLCEVRDKVDGRVVVKVCKSPSNAWSAFINGNDYLADHTYTLTAHVVQVKTPAEVARVVCARCDELAAAGEHVVLHKRGARDLRRMGHAVRVSRAMNSRKAIVCVETNLAFVNTVIAAEYYGCANSAVTMALSCEIDTAAGYHWRSVSVDDLTTQQRSLFKRAMDAFVMRKPLSVYPVLDEGVYAKKYRRAGGG